MLLCCLLRKVVQSGYGFEYLHPDFFCCQAAHSNGADGRNSGVEECGRSGACQRMKGCPNMTTYRKSHVCAREIENLEHLRTCCSIVYKYDLSKMMFDSYVYVICSPYTLVN